jgi:hypothetical protein
VNGIIICCAPQYAIRRILRCPICKTRRRILALDEIWYGTTTICCHCGDRWQDGELCPRPRRRGWRKEAAAKATARWLAAGHRDAAAHKAWVRYQLGEDQDGAA